MPTNLASTEVPGGGKPFGDIYYAQTPHIDQLTARIEADQKNRDLLRQKQAQVLDEEFRKNVAGIKDVDIPEYTKKYQDWKLAKQALMKTKPKNQDEYIAKQMEVQKKLADVYTLGNASKQAKDEEEELGKDIMKNPDNYDDNAFGMLSARRKLPLGQLNQYKTKGADGKDTVLDLTNPQTFQYKGTNFDFSKLDKDAQGTLKPTFQPEQKINDLQYSQKQFQFANTPAEYYQNILGGLSTHKADRAASAIVANTPPEVMKTIQDQYNAIPLDKWNKIGVNQPQNLDIKPEDAPAVKYAKHAAQLYFLNNEPKEGETKYRTDESAKIKTQQAFDLRKLAIQHANSVDLVNKHHDLTQGDKALEGLWIDQYNDTKKDEAKQTHPVVALGLGKSFGAAYESSVDPVAAKALTRDGKSPDKLYVTPDDKWVAVYYTRDKDHEIVQENNRPVVDKKLTQTLTDEQFKLALGKQAGTKQMNKEMSASKPTIAPTKKEAPKKQVIKTEAVKQGELD